MKKIAVINTTFFGGGAASVARDIFHALRHRYGDGNIFFFYGRGTSDASTPGAIRFGFALEVFLHAFFVRLLGIEGFGSYFSTRRLIKLLKAHGITTVHLHNLHGYYLNFFRLARFLQDAHIQVVWTLHDEWIRTSLKAHSMGCPHCLSGEGKCVCVYKYPLALFQPFGQLMLRKKIGIFGSDSWRPILVAPSDWLFNSLRGSFLKKFPILKIYNGVDEAIFYPRTPDEVILLRKKYDLPPYSSIVLFSASDFNDENKGFRYIVQCAKLLEGNPISFVGIGSLAAPSATLPSNIILRGYVSSKRELADYYALSDLFAICSAVETLPMAVLESLASGVPVAGFGIPALRDIFSFGEGGILVPFGDVGALRGAIATLASRDEDRAEKGLICRKIAEEEFSFGAFIEKYMKLFEIE